MYREKIKARRDRIRKEEAHHQRQAGNDDNVDVLAFLQKHHGRKRGRKNENERSDFVSSSKDFFMRVKKRRETVSQQLNKKHRQITD